MAIIVVHYGSKALICLSSNDEEDHSDFSKALSVSPTNHHQVFHFWVVPCWVVFLLFILRMIMYL